MFFCPFIQYLNEAESRRFLGVLAQSTLSRMRTPLSPAVLEAMSPAESEGNTMWKDTCLRTDLSHVHSQDITYDG